MSTSTCLIQPQQIVKLKNIIHAKNKEIKRLRSRVNRRNKKISSLQDILSDLKQKSLISDTAYEMFDVSIITITTI